MRFEPTAVTPYAISIEPGLMKRLDSHYGGSGWQSRKLRSFSSAHYGIDTVMMR
jgi:hypothetical protein